MFLNRSFDADRCEEIGTIPPDVLEEEHATVLKWIADEHIVSIRIHFDSFLENLHLFC